MCEPHNPEPRCVICEHVAAFWYEGRTVVTWHLRVVESFENEKFLTWCVQIH